MFGSLGFGELIIVIIVLAGIGILAKTRSSAVAGPTLVLRKFSVQPKAQDGVSLEIIGRASGLVAWILTTIGFDEETTLKLKSDELTFKGASLGGERHSRVRLMQISSTHCGIVKPISLLVLGVIFALAGILAALRANQFSDAVGPLLLAIIVGGGFLVGYKLLTKMQISIETTGGTILGLSFKKSVIENVPVGLAKAVEAIEVLNQRILESKYAS